MNSIISFITSNIVPVLIGLIGIVAGVVGFKMTTSANKTLNTVRKATDKAAESQQVVSEKRTEVQQQKEKDLAEIPKEGKERVSKANGKIKDFNSKI